jgi:cytoskeleton protein RodZ
MSEGAVPAATPDGPGAMLRAAREAQGLHIAALAASIKVSPRKLEALEADRWGDLPDATFVRALAQTVCRALKLDPGPILERLPRPATEGLAQVGGTLNTPFHPGGRQAEGWLARFRVGPLVLASALLMLAALVLVLFPMPWEGAHDDTSAPAPAPGAALQAPGAPEPTEAAASGPLQDAPATTADPEPAAAPEAPATAVVPPRPAAPALTPAAAPAVTPAASTLPASTALLRLRSTEMSWIEVRDASDRVLMARPLRAGETVELDGAAPLRLVVGNASATEVMLRGEPLDLAPMARNNVARVTLR